ncbi:hypothetical protein VTN77DRAFT_7360 [Rasamsonia byssochlamydoides]|uniref:uncharacterized protein n=1 Tax=Rasamsonia byssochlamydoides TaxID=89139 RepID=UPI0037431551
MEYIHDTHRPDTYYREIFQPQTNLVHINGNSRNRKEQNQAFRLGRTNGTGRESSHGAGHESVNHLSRAEVRG